MALDLTGIRNENEFYTSHYLDEILAGDLRNTLRAWRRRKSEEEGFTPPSEELGSLRRDYFELRQGLEREGDPAERMRQQRPFLERLLHALGYEVRPELKPLDDGGVIPILGEVARPNGAPELWIIEAIDEPGESNDPLALRLHECQLLEGDEIEAVLPGDTLTEGVSHHIFGREEPPRWVIVVSDSQLLLLDRTKWGERRLLRFDLSEILDRRERSTLEAMAALLHRESTCPTDGLALLDTLDENSHKHAFAVSEDLKYALRESIELLGNEAVWYLRERRRRGVFSGEEKLDADQLTVECLRYMYRLLFLFYIEARPELGYAPMKADAYRDGYSLENLRDLELVRLETEEAREGYYIDQSLELLFDLIYNGWPRVDEEDEQLDLGTTPEHHTFTIAPLKSHLFDPERTPILERVKFRNHVLQRIIRLMSLSDPSRRRGRRKKERAGRISYAQLGINQLGAVYEALLSYRGFFAEEDLYEVKRKGDKDHDELAQAYFVGEADLPKYDEEERVYNDDGTLRKHPRGTFIYRLAGRDRETSASYYTPEVLTQSLVKYALKELIGDDDSGMPADEILELTICEPAMGSAAFLNEAVNQLADAYMRRKQSELGENLTPDDFARERQRVKMHIANNNVFGVDLNPVATELAEVSLWLNTIHEGGFVPWFGLQLRTGNSLIGARRQVFPSKLLEKRKRGEPTWLDEVPERVPLGTERPAASVYHFLLPDKGMAAYNDRVIREMAGEELQTIRAWKREFTKPFTPGEIRTLERLSAAIDRLWERHVQELERIRHRTSEPRAVYGSEESNDRTPTTTREKDRILQQELLSEKVRNSSPYRRLELVMDYWCALWFWPIEEAELLPTRDEYLLELELLLEGEVLEVGHGEDQMQLFPDTMPKQLAIELRDEFGFVDVNRLSERRPRLALVRRLAERYRFHHWELEFADLFENRGGFDLVVGNPPWILVSWEEAGVMGDAQPLYAIRRHRAAELARLREEIIEEHGLRSTYLAAYEEADATQHFLNAQQNYAELQGMKANLYKCFLPQAWMIGRKTGISAYLHPEGIYDDPRGGILREAVYPRLRGHFQFWNALFLFSEVHDQTRFSINVYANDAKPDVGFAHIANLFTASTIDACFESNGRSAVPGIKDDENAWNQMGHHDRIVWVDDEMLELFARLYDEEGTPSRQARLPAVHSRQIVSVLEKFTEHPQRLGDLTDEYFATQHWNETNAQADGTIKYDNQFPESAREWIMSGPHFFVGTPFYKTPREEYRNSASYDVVDLTNIPDDYLPRTLYTPACEPEEYQQRTPRVTWGERGPVTDHYRFINRRMFGASSERSLISAILPKQASHINTNVTTVIQNQAALVVFNGLCSSIVYDFFLKTSGRSDLYASTLESFPYVDVQAIRTRALLLNCLTTHYADLWSECWRDEYREDGWAKSDPRLSADTFRDLTREWQRDCALRTDFERRQALVELDVLAAMALGLTLEELQTIYRVQFPVMRHYDRNTFYDQRGRIVYTNSRGLTGVGHTSAEWRKIEDKQSGTVERTIMDDTQPGGPVERTIVYEAPFTGVDREADYAEAWAHFEARFGDTLRASRADAERDHPVVAH